MKKKEKHLINVFGKCSPLGVDNINSTNLCLGLNELVTLAAMYNNTVTNNRHKIAKTHFKNPTKLINALDKKLHTVCAKGDDFCWINQPFVKMSDIYTKIRDNFRPLKPSSWIANSKTWLNTNDIFNVMIQYTKKYNFFSFPGVFPVDFMDTYNNSSQCITREMCGFNLKELIGKGKNEIGFVINLDKHDEPGSHWVAIYGNADPMSKKFGLCYYDSMGYPYNRYIDKFFTIYKEQATTLHGEKVMKKFQVKHNSIKHQHKNTECGIYSMIFLILCIENKNETFDKTLKRIGVKSDDLINEYRNKLYVPTM